GARSHPDPEAEGDLRDPGARLRSLRGRGQRDRRHRHQEFMTYVLFIIGVALVFDFLNGFHDAANSIATVVSTRVLSPRNEVAVAAFFNFVAAFGFAPKVATTIGKGVIHPDIVDPTVILCALLGASLWDLLTWWWGLPTSSSHALIGGLAGAAVMKGGVSSLVLTGLVKIASFIVLSPLIGMILGFLVMTAVIWIAKDA